MKLISGVVSVVLVLLIGVLIVDVGLAVSIVIVSGVLLTVFPASSRASTRITNVPLVSAERLTSVGVLLLARP